MKSLTILIAALFLIGAQFASSQTAEEIFEKSIKNYGGIEKIGQIKSWTITGKLFSVQMGAEVDFTAHYKAPDKHRFDIVAMGATIIQATDGEVVWMSHPLAGGVQELPKEYLEQVKQVYNMYGTPLKDYKSDFTSMEFLGKETIDGKELFKIKAVSKENQTVLFFFDPISYFVDRVNISSEEQPQKFEILYKNNGKASGIIYAKLIEVLVDGELAAKFEFFDVKNNIDIEDSIFAKPSN